MDPQTEINFNLWQNGAHASTFVEPSDGLPNNECARCHSPSNWMPEDKEDLPKACATCGFEIPAPQPIAESAWLSVGCRQCHRVEDDEVDNDKITIIETDPLFIWLNTLTDAYSSLDPYEYVGTVNELCQKCHTENLRETSCETTSEVHSPIGEQQCNDCHNPHSLGLVEE